MKMCYTGFLGSPPVYATTGSFSSTRGKSAGPIKRLAAILPETDHETACTFAQKLLRNVWGLCIPHDSSSTSERVTVSVGISTMSPNKLHAGELVTEAAEEALSAAQSGGGNMYDTRQVR